MCGLAAYCGDKPAAPFLMEALRRMEYRGYDSWGLATLAVGPSGASFVVCRRLGGASEASDTWANNLSGETGVGHTRWATHGKVCVENTHPVAGGMRQPYVELLPGQCKPSETTVQVVHNGIIENHDGLRKELSGYRFSTETDTEVVAHLFDKLLRTTPADKDRALTPVQNYSSVRAWGEVVRRLRGQFSLAAITNREPDTVFLAAQGSPLLISHDGYVASDMTALSGFTEDCFRLPDGYTAVLHKGGLWVFNQDGQEVIPPHSVSVPPGQKPIRPPETTCMYAEIREQPGLLRTLSPLPELPRLRDFERDFSRVVLYGCGSSYHAALLGKHYFQAHRHIPAHVEYATELASADCLEANKTLYIALTQSGETRDTLLAMKRVASEWGESTVCVTNGIQSESSRLARNIVPLGCGPEYGVAATKTFTLQCVKLYQLATKGMHYGTIFQEELPLAFEDVFARDADIAAMAEELLEWEHVLYLGRGVLYPIALEGALKMKEVAYKHAEAIHAAEMKHGPLALVDEETLSLVLVTHQDSAYLDKLVGNIQEIRARGGTVFAVGDKESLEKVGELSERDIIIPTVRKVLQPLVVNVALQLLSYHAAVLQGLNPDRPRSLAKALTVE